MPSLSVRALALLSCVVIAAPLRAQLAPDRPLSLEEAMAMAFKSNYGLRIQTNSNESQREAFKATSAAFDPTLTASLTRSMNQQASNNTTTEGRVVPRTDSTGASLGIRKLVAATNGTLNLTTALSKSATNSDISLFNTTFGNNIKLTYNQPLNTFGRAAATANIEIAKIGLSINNYNYTNQILTLISNVENAYYNLVTAREALVIRQNSLTTSQKSLDEARTRLNTGNVIPLDVTNAELQVSRNQSSLLQAKQSVSDAEDNLLNIITAGTDFSVRPGPVKFQDYTEGVPNFAETYKLAREHYWQTASQELTIKSSQISLDVARRNLRPNVSLDLGMGYTAANANDYYDTAIDNLLHKNGNQWNVGLNYTLPIGRAQDKARYRQAQITVESNKLTLEQLEQDLIRQVRTAIRSIETNLSTVQIQSSSTVYAQKQYDQTKARFDSGLSTNLLVLQAQDAVDTARNTELAAKLALRRAVSDLQRLTQKSFERYNIQPPQ